MLTPAKVKRMPVIIVEDTAAMASVPIELKDNSAISKDSRREKASQEVTTPKQRTSRDFKFTAPISVSHRTSRADQSSDRFIPRRRSSNRDYASFKLLPPSSPSEWTDDVFDQATSSSPVGSYEQYRRRMACLSEGASEAKVLQFGATGNLATAKGISRSQESFDPNMTFVRAARKLPKEPEQVLDLPGIENNYYSNTVTWGAKGHIIAAMGPSLYITKRDHTETAHQLKIKENQVYTSVACSSDGRHLAAGTCTGILEVFDIEQEKLISSTDRHHSHQHEKLLNLPCRICCISWKPNTNIFATGCRSGLVNHFDMRTCEIVITNADHKDAVVCGLSFSPSGNLLASSDSYHWLKIWDRTGQIACFSKEAHTSSCRALAWNPWKTGHLASGGGLGDGSIRLWNVFTGEMLAEVNTNGQVCSLTWSSITRELIASYSKPEKHVVSVFNYPDLKSVGYLPGHLGRVLHMGMGPCNTTLFTASADEMLKFWKIAESRPPTPVRCASCSFLSSLR